MTKWLIVHEYIQFIILNNSEKNKKTNTNLLVTWGSTLLKGKFPFQENGKQSKQWQYKNTVASEH